MSGKMLRRYMAASCYGGSHTIADGQSISNDCSACHQVLAAGEESPKILTDIGMK